jgi:hypothetical protein
VKAVDKEPPKLVDPATRSTSVRCRAYSNTC